MEPRTVFDALSTSVRVACLLASAFLAGCGEAPSRSLLQVMYTVDFDDQQLRAAVTRGDLTGARALAERLRASFADPAFERYLERPGLLAAPERFRESKRFFDQSLAELLKSIDGANPSAAGQSYARMRMACDLCHRDFRPGL